jgi:integrase
MGSVFNRGTRDKPKWYVQYMDENGQKKMVPSKMPTKEQAKRFLTQVESNVAAGKAGINDSSRLEKVEELLRQWMKGLRNRNAVDDKQRTEKHIIPVFGKMNLKQLTLRKILGWIDAQVDAGQYSPATIRHNMHILSRFFSWAIEQGHADLNPIKQIPTGRRPHDNPRHDIPWIQDDSQVLEIMKQLPQPINFMFYIGNQSGLRTGEIAGLRMSDLGFLKEGAIRVRYSYNGPLKEDIRGSGKMKWVPAPEDAEAVLGPWIEIRKAQEAGPEDPVFYCPTTSDHLYNKMFLGRALDSVTEALGLEMTWYQATRHSFVSRSILGGATLDEVSAAVGHSSPVVTRRYYDHVVRRSFSPALRKGLGIKPAQAGEAEVTPIPMVETETE